MSESVQIEFLKQLPLLIGSIIGGLASVGTLYLQWIARTDIKELKHATNSILSDRVEAAKDQGRVAERSDAADRKKSGEITGDIT